MTGDDTVHPSLLKRKIIHFDMDAFYANIEIRDRPDLKGRPVIVGGSPQSRGVVCTASYEARKFGVKSAMACSHAYRLCPDAVFLKPDFDKYSKVSQEIRTIFSHYTDKIEPLSLDEAYLDVTDNPKGLYAVKIARLIQQEVFATLKLTGSAGVAPNKLVAKIASDIKKPFGITVIQPQQVLGFMEHLPLRRIHGIGPASEKRLGQCGLRVCKDVWGYSLSDLEQLVGRQAGWLFNRARGIDDRDISMSRVRKSIGRETTFAVDSDDLAVLSQVIATLAESLERSCARGGYSGKTLTLKVKFADFTLQTRSLTHSEYVSTKEEIVAFAQSLLDHSWTGKKIRLLGISLSSLKKIDVLEPVFAHLNQSMAAVEPDMP